MTDLLNSRYLLVERVASGSMGVVWRAHDTVLDREVAIKELRPAAGVDPEEARDRFLVEARAAAKLSHPNIVAVHDVFSDGDRVLITMELVAGPTLAQVVSGAGPQRAEVVRAVMAQVAQALAGAHGAGVVHRDLKPENIFWTPEGRAVVADFGLARIGAGRGTMEGTVMGTPGYMAPEQVRGMVVGPAADVFAWGAVAYELATGRAPFGEATATDPSALAYRIVHQDPPALDLPEDPALAALIDRAMAKDPDDRPADGAELAFGLLTKPVSGQIWPEPAGGPAPPPVESRPAPPAAVTPPPTPTPAPTPVPAISPGPGALAVNDVARAVPPPAAPRAPVTSGQVVAPGGPPPSQEEPRWIAPPLPPGGTPVPRQRRSLLRRPKPEPAATPPAGWSARKVPVGVVFLVPAFVFLYLMVVVAAGGGASKNSGTIQPGEVTLNGVDPANADKVLLDFNQPLTVAGTAEPDTITRVRLEFSVLGIPLGSGNVDGLQHADGSFQTKIDAADTARFLVGGKVTTKLILYGKDDTQTGLRPSRSRTFTAASMQSSVRTVPAAIAAIFVLFLLAYLRSSIFWMIYGDRRSFETSNLVMGGAFAGFTVVILAWLFGAPEPDERVLVTCIALGVGFGIAMAVATYSAARRRDSRRRAAEKG